MSTDTAAESETFEQVCRELVERILDGDVEREDVEQAKKEVCGKYSSPKVPKNSDLLSFAPDGRRDELAEVVRRKPVRTASGVSPVAIMTSPKRCPHGKCLYCPGGPASEFSSAQSYTGHEPAAARGVQTDYDPYAQVTLRLSQLHQIGHPVEKVELILMGGTMTARSADYQAWFVRRCLEAMNDFDPADPPAGAEPADFRQDPDERAFRYLADVKAKNETATVRNVATTFETKPDWCDPEQLTRMLRLGGTKVELGVQTTHDEVNREMHRGHGVADSVDANRRLRDAAFKVGFHMMPGQPGMDLEMCKQDFRELFADPDWRPDYLKIYPTLVVKGTRVYDMWKRGDYEPLDNETAAELVAWIKERLPPYVRLQRVQRDIPADHIEAGVWKSNLRQLARQRLEDRGGTCDCIRCREAGHADEAPRDVTFDVLEYAAAGGTEHFLSFEDRERDVLVGFCRLRFPDDPVRRELRDAALVRELHVYGSEVGLDGAGGAAASPPAGDGGSGADGGRFQHRGYGRRLMARAEDIAREAGYGKLAVIAGIGARRYYREKLGYVQDGPYVSTRL
ncbi:MAG: tRNA uridine(34) 5-carboxymethylaminomethyl modification radical SAM/GNAT enzyme Elp3 [Halobacteriaceae archaeon]